MNEQLHHGVVRGKTIELQNALGLPDGQQVVIAIQCELQCGD
jgi:hypothetical protein